MTKIDKVEDNWGELVIRVWECKKFTREPQDIPICISRSIHNPENVKNLRMYDIMRQVEDYLYNNSGA